MFGVIYPVCFGREPLSGWHTDFSPFVREPEGGLTDQAAGCELHPLRNVGFCTSILVSYTHHAYTIVLVPKNFGSCYKLVS